MTMGALRYCFYAVGVPDGSHPSSFCNLYYGEALNYIWLRPKAFSLMGFSDRQGFSLSPYGPGKSITPVTVL